MDIVIDLWGKHATNWSHYQFALTGFICSKSPSKPCNKQLQLLHRTPRQKITAVMNSPPMCFKISEVWLKWATPAGDKALS